MIITSDNQWKSIYLKQYICKHIIGICIALKKCGQVPPSAKTVPFSTTSGPGRPRFAVLALLEQPQFRSLINDADLSELDDDENEISSELSTVNVNDPISLNNNSANNTNLIVNHQYEPNDYFDTNDPPPSRYDSQNQNMFSATDSNYATDSNFTNSNSFKITEILIVSLKSQPLEML